MKQLLRLYFALVAFCACAQMYATDITLHEGENKINVNDFVVNATYTAKSTGKVVLDAFVVFDAVTCDGVTYEHVYAPGALHGVFHYEVDAKAGQTIQAISNFIQ